MSSRQTHQAEGTLTAAPQHDDAQWLSALEQSAKQPRIAVPVAAPYVPIS